MLHDWHTAPIDERLRAMLGFLEKLTLEPEAVSPDDIAPLRAQGLSDAMIEEAIRVCAVFSVIDRVADTFEFEVPPPEHFALQAKRLLSHGYL